MELIGGINYTVDNYNEIISLIKDKNLNRENEVLKFNIQQDNIFVYSESSGDHKKYIVTVLDEVEMNAAPK